MFKKIKWSEVSEMFFCAGGMWMLLGTIILMAAAIGKFDKSLFTVGIVTVITANIQQETYFTGKRVKLLVDSHIDVLKQMTLFNNNIHALVQAQRDREERGY